MAETADRPAEDHQDHSEKVRLAFDGSVAFWRDFYRDPARSAERLRVFRDALGAVGASGLWLEAGCGIGVMARQFRESGLGVCGVDVAGSLLEEARSVTGLPLLYEPGASPPDEHLRVAQVERLPYRDAHFDGAYACSVLEYADDLGLALRELNRVVRNDGHLVFNLPNAFSVFRIARALVRGGHAYLGPVRRWAYWPWEITRLLERAGWQPKALAYYREGRHPGPLGSRRLAASFVLVTARKRR
jgi:SAM-dependent methyltransferase